MDLHLFSGLFCYLMGFWIVLLTKHCKISFYEFSVDKNKNSRQHELWKIVCDLGALMQLFKADTVEIPHSLASILYLPWSCSELALTCGTE